MYYYSFENITKLEYSYVCALFYLERKGDESFKRGEQGGSRSSERGCSEGFLIVKRFVCMVVRP